MEANEAVMRAGEGTYSRENRTIYEEVWPGFVELDRYNLSSSTAMMKCRARCARKEKPTSVCRKNKFNVHYVRTHLTKASQSNQPFAGPNRSFQASLIKISSHQTSEKPPRLTGTQSAGTWLILLPEGNLKE